MPLPASIIFLIASGASNGGSATPLPRATALSTAFPPPDAGDLPRTAADASRVGFASVVVPVSPGSAAAASAAEPACPATGATAFARDCGSGGSDTVASGVAVATIGEVAGAAA